MNIMKSGDFEKAEIAFKEFVDAHAKHELAGSAQFWYGETFYIRQLYEDAAVAFLDGYQKYPNSPKAPENLLKLGVTLAELGETEQGCKMITNLKKAYPKTDASILQKSSYEKKRFNCA
jgi:tol-pal system protein YbgF